MVSNTDIEMRWVDAWNDLYEIVGDHRDTPCLLPDGRIVDVETCKAWLQCTAYAGQLVAVTEGWVRGRRGVFATCRAEDP